MLKFGGDFFYKIEYSIRMYKIENLQYFLKQSIKH